MEFDPDLIPDQTFLQEGTHFVECTKAEYTKSTHGDWGYELTWTCLEESKRGRTMRDRLYASWKGDPSAKMCSRLKIAAGTLGLLPPKGQKANIPPQAWIGKRCWIEVVEGDPYQGRDGKMKTSFQITFAGYDVETPAPRDVGVPGNVVVGPPPAAPQAAFRPSGPLAPTPSAGPPGSRPAPF